MKLLRMLLDRLDEKTTWFAIGAALSAFGVTIEPGLWEGITMLGIGAAAVFLALLPTKPMEKRAADAVERRLPERLRDADELPSEAEADPVRRVRELGDIYGDFVVE
jgi:hypothetical protein